MTESKQNVYNFYFGDGGGNIENESDKELFELKKQYFNELENNYAYFKPIKKSLMTEKGYLVAAILTANEIDGEGDMYTEEAAQSIYKKLRKSFMQMKHGTNHQGNFVDSETDSIWYTMEPSTIDGLHVPENTIIGKFFIRDEEVKKAFREGKKNGVSLESSKAKVVNFDEFKKQGYTYAGDQVGLVKVQKGVSVNADGKFTNSRFSEPKRIIIDAEIEKVDYVDLPMNLRVSIFKGYPSSDENSALESKSVLSDVEKGTKTNNEVDQMEDKKNDVAETKQDASVDSETLLKGISEQIVGLFNPLKADIEKRFEEINSKFESLSKSKEDDSKSETVSSEPETDNSSVESALEKGFSKINESLRELLAGQKTVADETIEKGEEKSEEPKINESDLIKGFEKALQSMVLRASNGSNQESSSEGSEVQGDSLSKAFKNAKNAGLEFGSYRVSRDSAYNEA